MKNRFHQLGKAQSNISLVIGRSKRSMTTLHHHFVIVAGALCLSMSLQLHASPPFFLPGDAFFSGRINTRVNPDRPKDESLLLHYQHPDGYAGMYKWTVGTSRLRLTGLTADVWKVWEKASNELRRYDPETLVVVRPRDGESDEEMIEENPLSVFVYPKTFDITKFRPFMRYNENWPEECTALGVPHEDQFLPTFYRDSEHREWRDAKYVPALPVTLAGPDSGRKIRIPSAGGLGDSKSRPADTLEPATYPYDQAQIVLINQAKLRDLKKRNNPNLMPPKGSVIIVIQGMHWRECFSDGKNWTFTDPKGE